MKRGLPLPHLNLQQRLPRQRSLREKQTKLHGILHEIGTIIRGEWSYLGYENEQSFFHAMDVFAAITACEWSSRGRKLSKLHSGGSMRDGLNDSETEDTQKQWSTNETSGYRYTRQNRNLGCETVFESVVRKSPADSELCLG